MGQAAQSSKIRGLLFQWWVSGLIVVAILVLTLPGDMFLRSLALHGPAVAEGQWWLILTSQLVHLSLNHALLNVAGYLFVVYCFRRELSPAQELIILSVSMLAVGLGIYWFNPEIVWYYGLSGAIYGVLIGCVLANAPRMPVISGLFFMFVVGKVVYEQFFASPDRVTAQLIGGPVAIDAHLYGLLIGLFLGVAWLGKDLFYRADQ